MKYFAVALISMALAACSSSEHEDLRQWMNDASKDIGARQDSCRLSHAANG